MEKKNYQIIIDEKALKEFIEWLPDLSEEEMYYCCLFARSKYTKDIEGKNGIPHIKSDKAQLKRFTATKERLFQKIQQLECPVGSYFQNTHDVPQEALALYITVNPRSLWKATQQSAKHFVDCIITNARTMNPQAEAMSQIQKAKNRSHYVVFDIDSKEEDFVKQAVACLPSYPYDAFRLLETRGGYHLIVNPIIASKHNKKWYQNISTFDFVDQAGDIMIPVPGTYQGGFIPKFVSIRNFMPQWED